MRGWAISTRAHPRSRGENRERQQRVRRRRRLIPAHAGKTLFLTGHPAGEPAHPRSRGENAPIVSVLPFSQGSSPLTRGKRSLCPPTTGRSWLIPAHAGKTRTPIQIQRLRPAHPRSRGENSSRSTSRVTCSGSSPLTRGKPALEDVAESRERLIPAHAGKTTR